MLFCSLPSSPPQASPPVFSDRAMIHLDLLQPHGVDAQTIFLVACANDPRKFLFVSYDVLIEKPILIPHGRRPEGWLEEVQLQLVRTDIVQYKAVERIKIPVVAFP